MSLGSNHEESKPDLENEIRNICTGFGRIYRFKLITNHYGAFAFVTYSTQEAADLAITELKQYRHDHTVWDTEWAKY